MRSEDVARYLQGPSGIFRGVCRFAGRRSTFRIRTADGRSRSPSGRCSPCARRTSSWNRKLRELVQFGEENDAIGEKVHRVTLALMRARDLDSAAAGALLQPARGFRRAACRLAPVDGLGSSAGARVRRGKRRKSRVFADSLTHPYCSANAMFDTGGGSARAKPSSSHSRTFRCASEKAFGLLVLASEDPQRFYPGNGNAVPEALGRTGRHGAEALSLRPE